MANRILRPLILLVSFVCLVNQLNSMQQDEIHTSGYKCPGDPTIYVPLEFDFNKSDKKPVLIFDADQVLLDRRWDIPLTILCYIFDSHDPIELVAELHNIFNIDSDKINFPVEHIRAVNEFTAAFDKEVCAFDLDPAVDKLVEKNPILQKNTKSRISFAERLKHDCSYGDARQGSIDLLLKVHRQGYPIAIGTNQGYNTYKRLMDAQTVPNEDHYVVIYTCDHPNNARQNPRPGQFLYAKKPSGKYFKGLRKTLYEKDLDGRWFIFIDDNLENVKVAVKKGFIGIHFKSVEQTEKDLQMLGINL